MAPGRSGSGSSISRLQRTRPAGDGPSLMGWGIHLHRRGGVDPGRAVRKNRFDTIAERQQDELRLNAEIQQLRQTGADPARLSQLQAELRGLQPNIENGWIAMIQHYFLAAWVPPANTSNTFYTVHRVVDGYNRYTLRMRSEPLQSVAPGASTTFGGTLFVGPKIQDRSGRTGAKPEPHRRLRLAVVYRRTAVQTAEMDLRLDRQLGLGDRHHHHFDQAGVL